MIHEHTGEFAALLVALFWTITALSFESASTRVGSLSVNIIRLVIGLTFLTFFNWIYRGLPFPTDASQYNWFWLGLSALVGFVLGDLFLFESYTIVGSWFAMLIMTLAPPLAALFGWILLGEHLTLLNLAGMLLTFSGIALAMFSRKEEGEKFTINKPLKGILFAFLGAVGQGLGIVLSKKGMGNLDPFAATQIRIITAIVGFSIVISIAGRWHSIRQALRHGKGMAFITLGSFFGPFLGVSFSLMAIKYTSAGVASTIMAMVPIFIIPPSILFFKHKVTTREVIGAIISVTGVALFFL
jgi:drug/metabolite transporter (DMT)-like permease